MDRSSRPPNVAIAVTHRRAVGTEGLFLRRTFRVDDRRERLVLHTDPLGGAPRLLGMLGRDNRDRLAEVAHTVDSEYGLVLELEPVALLARYVLVRQHCVHAGHRDGLRDVDCRDARVSMRDAQRVPADLPGRLEVARVRELAGDL